MLNFFPLKGKLLTFNFELYYFLLSILHSKFSTLHSPILYEPPGKMLGESKNLLEK